MICKNCGKTCTENFCPACGQKTATDRLTLYSMAHNVILGIFNCDRGIFYTVRSLFTRPGYMIREYLEGKRIRYFAPFQMLFVTAAIYVLLHSLFGLEAVDKLSYATEETYPFIRFMQGHIAFVYLLTIPLNAPLYRWIFGKRFRRTYNWAETLYIGAYIVVQQALLSLANVILLYLCHIAALLFLTEKTAALAFTVQVTTLTGVLLVLLYIFFSTWTFRQLLGGSWLNNLWRIVAVNILFFVLLVFITAAVMVSLYLP